MNVPRTILVTLGCLAGLLLLACGGAPVAPSSTVPTDQPTAAVPEPPPTVVAGGPANPPAKPIRPEATKPSVREAWVMARQFLERDYLRSPSTASYGSVFGEYQDPDRCVTPLGSGDYLVRGWVDAQNGFGATVRTNFVIKLHHVSGHTWRMVGEPAMAVYPDTPQYVDREEEATRAAKRREAAAKAEWEKRRKLSEVKREADAAREAAIEKAKWRTWTSVKGGHQLDAKFVRLGGGRVTLEKADGSTIQVKFDQLCAEDRRFITDKRWLLSVPLWQRSQ